METIFNENALKEFNSWILENRKNALRILDLIKSIDRDGVMKGLGKPEKLKYEDGYSRRIDEKNRLIYRVENGYIYISSCKGHYKD